MKTVDMLRARRGQPVSRADLRTVATTLGIELAHGAAAEVGPVLEELAWIEVEERDAPYALALEDVSTALVGEQAVVAARVAASRAVVKPSWWRVLDALRASAEPRTATQLAPELQTSVSSVHRWMGRLTELGMIEEIAGTSNRDRPFGLTPLGLSALEGRPTSEERGAAHERADLVWCARRPVQHLGMEPLDRTLYWALLYVVDELLARDAWSPDEVQQARDLRRFLVALGQPAAADDPFRDSVDEDGSTRTRLEAFWWYRDIRGQLDLGLDGERRFLAAMPPAEGIGWPLAWSIAANRVAHNVGLLVDKLRSDRERQEARDLQSRLRREARRLLGGLHVPLAEFWRDHAEAGHFRDDVLGRITAAPLGVEDTAVVYPNLELCRAHLRICTRDNQAWEPMEREMRKLYRDLSVSVPHVRWGSPDALTWLQANPETVHRHLLQFLAGAPTFVTAAREWISTVQLEDAVRQVPTIDGDGNIFHKHHACKKLVAFAGHVAAGDGASTPVVASPPAAAAAPAPPSLSERVQHGQAVRLEGVDVATITELLIQLPVAA